LLLVQFSDTSLVQMRTWQLQLSIPEGGLPMYRRIARVIAADIERGRLRLGERLPSTRVLADELGVNRNTVVAAFEELRHQGLIGGQTTSGTYVLDRASLRPEPDVLPAAPGFELPPALPRQRPVERKPGLLLLLGGVPDLRLLPHRELARAYRRAIEGSRGRRAVDYADPQGHIRLRLALGEMLSRTRGILAPPESICVVRGSQQGLYLAAQALLSPGDVVAVEAVGFPPAWQAMQLAGAELVPLPVDAEGLDISALEALLSQRRVRAVVTTPHHQYPTTVTLSPARRQRLLALAAQHRVVVLEDDYDHEFHYDGPSVLPLAAHDPAGVVVYIGTLSKSLAPGLRLGYVVARPEVIARLTDYRIYVDQQGDHVLEQAVAMLFEDGDVARHARKARRAYHARRDVLCAALHEHLPELQFTPPSGGMAVWARAPGVDTERWAERGLQAGVAFQSGSRLTFGGGPSEYVRLGFAACQEQELEQAARRLAICRG
jgi:GntR family transcriptional regulator/MocR family aminotransferase